MKPIHAFKYTSSLFLLIAFLGSSKTGFSQQALITDGTVNIIEADVERYLDFIIPRTMNSGQLNLEAEGADGGWIEYNYYDRFNTARTQRVNGGEGATISATFDVGTGFGQIPPGSILRFIIGNRGQKEKIDSIPAGGIGAGGGGGTGVLLSKDNGNSWHLIMVASGGGGGAIKIFKGEIKSRSGFPGSSEEVPTKSSQVKEIATGGTRGGGGHSFELTGGGGGAYEDGIHKHGLLNYGTAGWKEHRFGAAPLGGLGGSQEGSRDGGWGFGGAGAGNKGGGGGGGYDGGGAGQPGIGGGGGSSFVEKTVVRSIRISKKQNEDTDNPGHGFIRYQLKLN